MRKILKIFLPPRNIGTLQSNRLKIQRNIDLFRYSYKVVEPEAPAAEESRSVAGRPVANIIQASAEKEVEEEQELAAAITEIEANDSAQSVELVEEEEEEEPVAVTQATPASYYYRFY